jgi:hypothetical protein
MQHAPCAHLWIVSFVLVRPSFPFNTTAIEMAGDLVFFLVMLMLMG